MSTDVVLELVKRCVSLCAEHNIHPQFGCINCLESLAVQQAVLAGDFSLAEGEFDPDGADKEDAAAPVDIVAFRGPHAFLSNFSAARITMRGAVYATAEHAFQAAKTLDLAERETILNAETPAKAKQLGRRVKLRADWNKIHLEVMTGIVRQKFRDPLLRAKLVATGDSLLIEGNDWKDTYWGVSNGKGQNHLGRILMQVRDECNAREVQA